MHCDTNNQPCKRKMLTHTHLLVFKGITLQPIVNYYGYSSVVMKADANTRLECICM